MPGQKLRLVQKSAPGLKVEGMHYLCGENKGADQLRARICVFVFAYAKSRFSHNAAQIVIGF